MNIPVTQLSVTSCMDDSWNNEEQNNSVRPQLQILKWRFFFFFVQSNMFFSISSPIRSTEPTRQSSRHDNKSEQMFLSFYFRKIRLKTLLIKCQSNINLFSSNSWRAVQIYITVSTLTPGGATTSTMYCNMTDWTVLRIKIRTVIFLINNLV